MPDSNLLAVWERVHLVALVVVCFLYPFVASFFIGLHNLGYGENTAMTIILVFTYILDGILFADFLMRFNLATHYTSDLKEIRHNYTYSSLFWVDLMAVLPIELFLLTSSSEHDRWHSLAFLKLNRLLKAVRISTFFKELENRLDSDIGKVRSLKFSIYITLSTHLCACAWFFEACYGESCVYGSWAQHILHVKGSAGVKEYVASMYWAAASMSSTGYGDIHAHDDKSQLLSVLVMLVGLLLYGYCLSAITATLANSATPKVQFQDRISAVVGFMVNHHLTPLLVERAAHYLQTLWDVHKGEFIPGCKNLMDDMPITLQQDVCVEECKKIMEKVPIFMHTEESFIRQLSLQTISYLFSPGDFIVYAGDMGREMYIIRRGLVEVIAEDGETILATLGPGGFFGEIGLIYGERRLATVQAKTYCQILMLTKENLDNVLATFPLVASQLKEAGVNRVHLSSIRKAATASKEDQIRRVTLQSTERMTVRKKSFRERIRMSLRRVRKNQILPERGSELDRLEGINIEDEFKQPYRDLSPVARIFSFLLQRRCLSPDNVWFMMWQGFTILASGVYIITLILQTALMHINTPLWILNYILDLIFLVDIYVKFHVGFYNENHVLVMHPVFTARNYLRTNFFLDLLSCFPTDIIVLAVWPEKEGVTASSDVGLFFDYCSADWWVALVAEQKMRFCDLTPLKVQFFGFMEESVGTFANTFRRLKFAVYMSLFTHYVACGWLILACEGQKDGSHLCKRDSWAMNYDKSFGVNDTIAERYIVSLYWAAATTASVGYGDLHAFDVNEMSYAFICMIIGIVFYGYIIASVAAGLANADARRARYQERLNAIKNFLTDQDIKESLSHRIVSHYEYLWIRNRGVDPSSLFLGLPTSLRAAITLSLYKDIIEKVPLFQGTEIGFLKMLSLNVKPVYFLAKEYVVKKGDIGHEMYFIHEGQVEVVSEHEVPIVFATMGAGRFFGEISVVFSCPRTASVRTKTNCDVFMLTKMDLDEVLSHYPLIKTKILETAEERHGMVRERWAAIAAKKKEEEERKKQEEEDRKRREEENKDKEGTEEVTEDEATLEKKDQPTEDDQDKADAKQDVDKPNCCITCLSSFVNLYTRFVIKPESKLRYITIVNCLLIFASSITITYMAAFQDHPWYLIAFNYICEAFFYTEIFFNFHMAYIDNVGEVMTDRTSLALHYAQGKFPFDMLASFPVDIFALAGPEGRTLEILSFLRLVHLLRIVRMQQFFAEYAQKLDIDVFKVRMSKFVLEVVLVVHVFACGWYFIDCPGARCSDHHSWIESQGLITAPPMSVYCTAVYWVVATVTSTGYGDVHANNEIEMVYASCVMVIGKLLFGFILGNIASTLANAEIGRVKYEEKLGAIQAHMEEQHIPARLQQRVMNFYEFLWNSNKGVEHDSLFFDMPQCMNGELAIALTGDTIKKVPLFEGAEMSFIRLLCTKVKPCQFHAKEYILRKGDIGQEMYIIKKGFVEVVTEESPPEVIETLEAGTFFGETGLVVPSPRGESIRAATHVDIFVLKKEDLDDTLDFYDDMKVQVQERARKLYGLQKHLP